MKKILLVIAIFLLLLSLIFIGPGWFFSKVQRAEVTNKINSIELDVKGVNTKIISKNQNDIEAKVKGKGFITLSQKGDAIEIEYHRRWFEFLNFFGRTELTVTIPENYNRHLELDVDSGNIYFQSAKAMVLNSLELDVSSGNIHLKSLKAKKAIIDVSSGNVNLERFSGHLEADVSSGNLTVQLDELIGDIEAEVSSGRIVLDLPEDSDFTLNGAVSSGHIHTRFPLINEKRDEHRLQGTYGSGKYRIHLEVSSGIIDIR